MFQGNRYRQMVRKLLGQATEELIKVMLRNEHPDLYFNLEDRMTEALNMAYAEGFIKGKREVMKAIKEFDESKDPLES